MNYLSIVPAITTLLGASAARADIQRQTDAALKNIESLATTQKFTQAQKSYQLEQMNEVLADKLSISGLEAMKQEATLKAASAETGARGGSIQESIEQAFIDENFRNSAIVRDSRIQKDSLKMSMIADRLNFSNQMEAIQYAMLTPLSAGLKTLGAGMQGLNYGMNMIPYSSRNSFLGVNTTGVK